MACICISYSLPGKKRGELTALVIPTKPIPRIINVMDLNLWTIAVSLNLSTSQNLDIDTINIASTAPITYHATKARFPLDLIAANARPMYDIAVTKSAPITIRIGRTARFSPLIYHKMEPYWRTRINRDDIRTKLVFWYWFVLVVGLDESKLGPRIMNAHTTPKCRILNSRDRTESV